MSLPRFLPPRGFQRATRGVPAFAADIVFTRSALRKPPRQELFVPTLLIYTACDRPMQVDFSQWAARVTKEGQRLAFPVMLSISASSVDVIFFVRSPSNRLTHKGGEEYEHNTRIGVGSVGALENWTYNSHDARPDQLETESRLPPSRLDKLPL